MLMTMHIFGEKREIVCFPPHILFSIFPSSPLFFETCNFFRSHPVIVRRSRRRQNRNEEFARRIPRLFLSRSIVLPPAWVVKRTLIERPPFQTCVSSLHVIYCFLDVPLRAYLLAATSEAVDFAKSATRGQTKASWHLSPMMTSVALLWRHRALNVLSSPSAWGRQRWRLYKFTRVQHSYLESPADLARLLRKVKGRLGRRASLWLHNQLGQE